MKENSNLTVFGACVLELMSRRGIRTWKALSERLAEHGFDYKPSRISNWAFGRHAVDRYFGHALATTLGLSAEERGRLADAFLFGQDVAIRDLLGESVGCGVSLPIPETKTH